MECKICLWLLLYRFNIEDKVRRPSDFLIFVYFSAGVGRTGTFMALDFLIKQGEREGFVDVISCVASMRHQRVHVVQTVVCNRFFKSTCMHTCIYYSLFHIVI